MFVYDTGRILRKKIMVMWMLVFSATINLLFAFASLLAFVVLWLHPFNKRGSTFQKGATSFLESSTRTTSLQMFEESKNE